MTTQEYQSRIAQFKSYKAHLDNILNFDCGEGSQSSYNFTHNTYYGVDAKTISYTQQVYDSLILANQNNFLLITVDGIGDVKIKKAMVKRVVGYDVYFANALIECDDNFLETTTYQEFDFIPSKNPFLFSTSKVDSNIKGEYVQYDPPKLINNNETIKSEIIGSGIWLESKDNIIGEATNTPEFITLIDSKIEPDSCSLGSLNNTFGYHSDAFSYRYYSKGAGCDDSILNYGLKDGYRMVTSDGTFQGDGHFLWIGGTVSGANTSHNGETSVKLQRKITPIESLKINIASNIGTLKYIVRDFLDTAVLLGDNDFTVLNNATGDFHCYGIAINHLYKWIDETVDAYNANIANIAELQTRLPSANFSIQDIIAEPLGLREAFRQVEYGGDMSLAELEMCVHFADGLESLSYDNKLSICNDLQIAIEQLVTKAELKTKLNNYAGFDNLFAYSTKTATYLVSSADADAQFSSVSVTVQVGYITKNVFGLPIGKFATIIQYGATFNTDYKDRCEFDKLVGVIIMIVGMAFGNPYAIAIGMAITVVVKIIVKLLVDANVIGEKDAVWIEAALNVAAMLTTGFLTDWTYFAPTATSSLASTAGATATNTVAPTTAASVAPTTVAPTTMASVAPTAVNTASMSLWQGLNVGLQALSGIVKSVSVYEQSQSEQFVEQAKKDMEQMSQDLAQMQEKTIYFTNDKFYNLYDEAYKIPAIDYDKLYNF